MAQQSNQLDDGGASVHQQAAKGGVRSKVVVRPELPCINPSAQVRERADWARRNEHCLKRPYPTALYRNRRSGIQWQVYDEDSGVARLRRFHRYKAKFFRFMWTSVPRENLLDDTKWRYEGPTPEDNPQYGYDTQSAQAYLLDGYVLGR